MSENGQTPWHLVGEEIGTCNCDWACPCQFEGDPTHGGCHAVIAYAVADGKFGDTDLNGVKFAEIVHWSGPIYEGGGSGQLIIDDAASPEQHDAVEKLVSGEQGGTYFEVFASVISNHHETLSAPIEIDSDREGRTATVRIGDLAEARIEPIKSPVDGSEHRVRIDLPNGFEYKQAEIGNTVSARAGGSEPLAFTLENTYAQLNPFDWGPGR